MGGSDKKERKERRRSWELGYGEMVYPIFRSDRGENRAAEVVVDVVEGGKGRKEGVLSMG